jgi:hypothetical protein
LALQSISGMNPTGIRSEYTLSNADVNNDGKIGLAETLYILQLMAGVRTSYFIEGMVFLSEDPHSGPLSGVTILLTGTSTASTITDSNGNFVFTGLQNGSYTVTPAGTFVPSNRVLTIDGANIDSGSFRNIAYPKFATANIINDLDKISSISRFRSGVGHDYSDFYESCSSMRHYFNPKENIEQTASKIYSPINGMISVIIGAGEISKSIVIRSTEYPSFAFTIVPVRLNSNLIVGSEVRAGEEIGDWVESSIEIDFRVDTPKGFKQVSYFDVITDAVFQKYQQLGVSSRSNMIISKAARDADPLLCDNASAYAGFLTEDGFRHNDAGNIENFIYFSRGALSTNGYTVYQYPSGLISMLTPYVNSSDIASLNTNENRGIVFSPNGNYIPIQAVAPGVVDAIRIWHDEMYSGWHVTINIKWNYFYSYAYDFTYNFPGSFGTQADIDNQLAEITVSVGQIVVQGDVIANLVKVNSGSYVVFSLLQNSVKGICPESYFTPLAKDSILGMMRKDNPTVDMCN